MGCAVDATGGQLRQAAEGEEEEEENLKVAVAFYEALAAGDAGGVRALLATADLEWWFHGPACDQHLMRFLTGTVATPSFAFRPLRARSFRHNVFVEGLGAPHSHDKVWVHVWTIEQGKIVQLREYFNTTLTVLQPSSHFAPHDPPLWQSLLPTSRRTSLPSLILAI